MRRTLLLPAALSIVFGVVGAAAPSATDASTSKVIITLPTSVTRGKLTMARISMPGRVAAVDGRVLVSAKAAEVVGVAVPRHGVGLMPVSVRGGYAFGAYALRASHGRTVIDVVLLPVKSGRIGIGVRVDAMADAGGRRLSTSGVGGLSGTRTLGVRDASHRAGTRQGTRVYGRTTGATRIGIPLATTKVAPSRAARGLRSLYGSRRISNRDQDYARQAWTMARARGQVCGASRAIDPNDDGCADIVDVQATLAAKGRLAGRSAITSNVADATSSRPDGTRTDRSDDDPPAATQPPTPDQSTDPDTSPDPTVDPATSPEVDAAGEPDSSGAGVGAGGAGKGAAGKSARRTMVAAAVTSDATGRTYTVTSAADTADAVRGDGRCADTQGRCTLRAAITEADFRAGDDRIEFDVPGAAPVTIQLAGRLPYITSRKGTLTIDGYSQAGASVNTLDTGTNAVPGIELRGNGSSAKEVGLLVTSPGNTIRGLLIDNMYRGIMLDGADAHDNRIVGNLIGFTRSGDNAPRGNFAVVLNTGANHNTVGTPNLANRNVIGNFVHAIEAYGAGTNGNVIQNNLLCIGPNGQAAPCSTAIDHNFGPKDGIIGGDGDHERNVIGPTYLQGIEFSHGWDRSLPHGTDTATTYQINGNTVIGNWIGFRTDGSYDPGYRSGLNASTADNAQGINVYDGSNRNRILRNYVASVYDGIQVMAPNATGNVVKGNVIGEAPSGEAAPLTGWGIKLRWSAKRETVSGNTIRNAALGGIGLVQDTVYNIRISRNIVTDTIGPAIYLAPRASDPSKGANARLVTPVITTATTDRITGTGIKGALVEVYRAGRAAGEQGLPVEFLGDATVAGDGTWHLDDTGIDAGQRVSALQIRSDDNTSAMAINVEVTPAAVPPQSGDLIISDDFDRARDGDWGTVDQGAPWTLTGSATDFSVDGSSGRVTTPASASREARISVGSTVDTDITATLTLDRVPVGSHVFAYVLARASGTNAYRAAIRIAPDGRIYAQLRKAVANAESSVGAEVAVAGLTMAAGAPIGVRFRIVGADMSLRVWDATGAEPVGWTVTGSDTTAALQGGGAVGLRTYVGSGVTNGPITLGMDGLRVRVP